MIEFLTELIGRLLVLWVVIFMIVVLPLTVIAQLWAFGVALRQRQWLKTVLLATPLGYFYLQQMALKGPFWRGIFGFAIVRGEPLFLSLFKLAANVAGWSAVVLLLLAILLGSLRWAIIHW